MLLTPRCSKMLLSSCLMLAALALAAQPSIAQPGMPADPLSSLKFRQIGPFRGGRVGAVAGVQSQPLTFYFGGTGGGVFKTTDGGARWVPMTDGQFKLGSVGAIAVADSDPNIVYVGTGEGDLRGNASHGDGVWKSTDAGHTWKNIGLAETQQIGALQIDPKNPDIVYVAAMGHWAGANAERGVFRTQDGGKTWKKVLYKSDKAGAIDVQIDPMNTQVIYAAIYQYLRQPWNFDSGGPDSGIWKSTDGGDTWKELTRNPGLPAGVLGRIGIAISPVQPGSVWANVEAAKGGIFHSADGGATWTMTNNVNDIKQRSWYYSRIWADPKNADTMYAVNTSFFKSIDGGHNFKAINTPHGDNHDLWIAREDPNRMIESNDGGANVTFDGGTTWSSVMNQPTPQFYRVVTDNDFPYHIYGAQQDNTTVMTSSRGNSGTITESDWHPVGGGESGWIAPDPTNSRWVYAGSYDGLLTRYDSETGGLTDINPWPDNPMGSGVEAMKYRLQWNAPMLFSPNDPKLLYLGSQYLMGTRDGGHSWTVMSPDLTRNDKSKQGPAGGPITKDNTAVEYYDTVFAIDESTVQKGVIWVGSDDGLVHVTRDAGKTWDNVTPKGIPDWIRINCIAASPFDAGTAYFAATMYLSDDLHPFLYKTTDFGKTWTKIVSGIPDDDFTRSIRPDFRQKGLLFAGTEAHFYVSSDDGASWKPFQLNLPNVPITDITFQKREDDLVISTQGRGFYVLDDMPMVRQLIASGSSDSPVHLYTPKETYRYMGGGFGGGGLAGPTGGANPPSGVVLYYNLKARPTSDVVIKIRTADGKLVNEISSKPAPEGEEPAEGGRRGGGGGKPTTKPGINRYVWNMHYADATVFPGMILWGGSAQGPSVVPGTYTVELTVDGHTETAKAVIKADPRVTTSAEDYKKQLDLALEIRDKFSEANQAVIDIRKAKEDLAKYSSSSNTRLAAEAKRISDSLTPIEEAIYQTRLRAGEDALNFPIKLNNKIAAVGGTVMNSENAPTEQSYAVFKDLSGKLQVQLDALNKIASTDVAGFNKLVRDQNIPAITIKTVK